jgi:hypothetical protein
MAKIQLFLGRFLRKSLPKKGFSKVRDKWQRKIPGMPIYVSFRSPLLKIPRIYVPNGIIVFHGHPSLHLKLCMQNMISPEYR